MGGRKYVYVNQVNKGLRWAFTRKRLYISLQQVKLLRPSFNLWFVYRFHFYFLQMIVAVLSTKIDLYFAVVPTDAASSSQDGIWGVAEIRSDYAQILSCLFL